VIAEESAPDELADDDQGGGEEDVKVSNRAELLGTVAEFAEAISVVELPGSSTTEMACTSTVARARACRLLLLSLQRLESVSWVWRIQVSWYGVSPRYCCHSS
jgi:hypothetical protein